MRRGIRKATRQGNPNSLVNAQRGVTFCFPQLEEKYGTEDCVNVVDLRTGQRLATTVLQADYATSGSFSALGGRSPLAVACELLNEGAVLATKKHLFWTDAYYEKRRRAARRYQIRRAA